jgi:hypothetical protein
MAAKDGYWLVFNIRFLWLREVGMHPTVEDALAAFERYLATNQKTRIAVKVHSKDR